MKLYIKYMVSLRCKLKVKEELVKMGIRYVLIDLGKIELPEEITPDQREQLKSRLLESGLELLDDHRSILIDRIKTAIVELIHYSDELPKVKYSEYLSAKLNHNYTYLANTFSEVTGVTIQKFIILHKIERVKELLLYDQLTLSEIAYKLHYSSPAHLSTQFKKVTGLTPTFFKQLKIKRQNLENM